MKLYIPALGDELVLQKDWTFDLHLESRNDSLINLIEGRSLTWDEYYDAERAKWLGKRVSPLWDKYPKKFTLPKNTKLAVDRIYIRKGAKEFDSVTFRILESSDARLIGKGPYRGKKCRFWAKLDDVNQMEVEG